MFRAKFAPPAPAAAPTFTAKFAPLAVEKASVELTGDGHLNITAEPGETVSLRPDPTNGDLSEVVVVDGDGNEETVELPQPGETAYSASSDPANEPADELIPMQPQPGQQPAQP
jgi:hypothetical protein